ncbi:hypothetical protein R6Q59_022693 [Mikania micrantha]|uniref:Organ specific protein n=1 Tax=Mikania micrantha TaxID=192012 RepID=A0A5N6N0H9_9ASTR|nr:hypothetical protein E3N88_27743 [Mikania micrantha]
MRSSSVFLVLFSLLLIASLHEARKDPEEYVKSVTKDEPVPKTNQGGEFARDFDTRPNLKMFTNDFNPIPASLLNNNDPPKKN